MVHSGSCQNTILFDSREKTDSTKAEYYIFFLCTIKCIQVITKECIQVITKANHLSFMLVSLLLKQLSHSSHEREREASHVLWIIQASGGTEMHHMFFGSSKQVPHQNNPSLKAYIVITHSS